MRRERRCTSGCFFSVLELAFLGFRTTASDASEDASSTGVIAVAVAECKAKAEAIALDFDFTLASTVADAEVKAIIIAEAEVEAILVAKAETITVAAAALAEGGAMKERPDVNRSQEVAVSEVTHRSVHMSLCHMIHQLHIWLENKSRKLLYVLSVIGWFICLATS